MKICITVNCPAILREFLVSRNGGSDVLKVDYNDVFARKFINLLEPKPVDCNYFKPAENHVKVEISHYQIGNIRYSSEYRNYLSEESQNSIVYEWNNSFKEIFHNYVLAYCRGMKFKIPCQKKAIMAFL